MSDKEKYIALSSDIPHLPIFIKPWWLDAVCGKDNWDVCVVEKGKNILGVLPYYQVQKGPFKILTMPRLTPYMGVWLNYPEGQKNATRLSFSLKTCKQLMDQLPAFSYFKQDFHYEFANWLPFYWQGFQQTTRYTYILHDLSSIDDTFSGFKNNIKRQIRKAKKNIEVTVSQDINRFYSLYKQSLQRQGGGVYPFSFINKIDATCGKHKSRQIFLAKDKQGNVHSALYLTWDDTTCYYLLGGIDPNFKASGSMSLLMWEAIQFAAEKNKKFNFEGSMIPSIERFFRSFGGKLTPYQRIYKHNSLLLQTGINIKNRLGL